MINEMILGRLIATWLYQMKLLITFQYWILLRQRDKTSMKRSPPLQLTILIINTVLFYFVLFAANKLEIWDEWQISWASVLFLQKGDYWKVTYDAKWLTISAYTRVMWFGQFHIINISSKGCLLTEGVLIICSIFECCIIHVIDKRVGQIFILIFLYTNCWFLFEMLPTPADRCLSYLTLNVKFVAAASSRRT
jgi:hypothetical protein